MQRLSLQLIWHYLFVGIGTAIVIALLIIQSLHIKHPNDFAFLQFAVIPVGLVIGAASQVMRYFMLQAPKKPLVLIGGILLIITTLCMSNGWMLTVYIPLFIECFILIMIEMSLPQHSREKAKRAL